MNLRHTGAIATAARTAILTTSVRLPTGSAAMAFERERHIAFGLARFLRMAAGSFAQVIFVENTLSEDLLRLFLDPILAAHKIRHISLGRNEGLQNKGAGMASMIQAALEHVESNAVLHFDPRKIVKSTCQLLNLDGRENVFKEDFGKVMEVQIPFYYRHFQTHMFQMRSDLAREYFTAETVRRLVSSGLSVERDLYLWMRARSAPYHRARELGLLWHEKNSDGFWDV